MGRGNTQGSAPFSGYTQGSSMSNFCPPQSNRRILSLTKGTCGTRKRFRFRPYVLHFAKSLPTLSRLTSGGPIQFEDVPQMLRGVLNVDARAGGHGPSHESPVRPTLVPLPPHSVQFNPATTPLESRRQSTTQNLPAVSKPPPGLRP